MSKAIDLMNGSSSPRVIHGIRDKPIKSQYIRGSCLSLGSMERSSHQMQKRIVHMTTSYSAASTALNDSRGRPRVFMMSPAAITAVTTKPKVKARAMSPGPNGSRRSLFDVVSLMTCPFVVIRPDDRAQDWQGRCRL